MKLEKNLICFLFVVICLCWGCYSQPAFLSKQMIVNREKAAITNGHLDLVITTRSTKYMESETADEFQLPQALTRRHRDMGTLRHLHNSEIAAQPFRATGNFSRRLSYPL